MKRSGMVRVLVSVLAGSLMLGMAGCSKSDPAPAPPVSAPPSNNGPGAQNASNEAGTTEASPTAETDASSHEVVAVAVTGPWKGSAEGQGADPPIHEIVPKVVAEDWKKKGSLSITVPNGDGTVTGTLTFDDITFAVRGFRSGAHVRGTIDQQGQPEGPVAEGFESPEDRRFRGTFDAELTGTASLQGSWEASSQAGLRRRRGKLDAAR